MFDILCLLKLHLINWDQFHQRAFNGSNSATVVNIVWSQFFYFFFCLIDWSYHTLLCALTEFISLCMKRRYCKKAGIKKYIATKAVKVIFVLINIDPLHIYFNFIFFNCRKNFIHRQVCLWFENYRQNLLQIYDENNIGR